MKVRTHRCGELTKAAVGQKVVLNGWVQRRRDHGMVMFMDLRDRTGLTQVVFNAENKAVHEKASGLRSEYVIAIVGTVNFTAVPALSRLFTAWELFQSSVFRFVGL